MVNDIYTEIMAMTKGAWSDGLRRATRDVAVDPKRGFYG